MYEDVNIAILRKQKNDGCPTTHCPTNKRKEKKNEFSQKSPQKTQQEK